MNRKQISKFAQKVNFNKPVEIEYIKDKKYVAYLAKKTIYINLKNIENDLEMAWILMHEIGHLNTTSTKLSEMEYNAHMWAISRANELGMYKIKRELIIMFKYWLKFNWNSDKRRYIMAAKIYFKNNS